MRRLRNGALACRSLVPCAVASTHDSPGLGLGRRVQESNDLVGDGGPGEEGPGSTPLHPGNRLTRQQTEIVRCQECLLGAINSVSGQEVRPRVPPHSMALGASLLCLWRLATRHRGLQQNLGLGMEAPLASGWLSSHWDGGTGSLGAGAGAGGWGLQAWWRPTLLLRGAALLVWGEAGGGQADQCGLREESRSQVCSWAMGPCAPEPGSWKPGLLLTCSYLRM